MAESPSPPPDPDRAAALRAWYLANHRAATPGGSGSPGGIAAAADPAAAAPATPTPTPARSDPPPAPANLHETRRTVTEPRRLDATRRALRFRFFIFLVMLFGTLVGLLVIAWLIQTKFGGQIPFFK